MRILPAVFTALCLWPAVLTGCQTGPGSTIEQQPSTPAAPEATPAAAGFSHDDVVGDPFADTKQVSPTDSARSHICGKPRYQVMGNILSSRGVNLPTTITGLDPTSAAVIYSNNAAGLGSPDYTLRVGEGTGNTAGGLIRTLDVLIAAADEIIANLGKSAACPGAALFNADGSCNADGFTCLAGVPLSAPQLSLCTTMAQDTGFTDAAAARRLTVAAVLGTTMPCDD